MNWLIVSYSIDWTQVYLLNVTLADEDTNSIQTDYAIRAILDKDS